MPITPGPWGCYENVVGSVVYHVEGRGISAQSAIATVYSGHENAQLIAAAPGPLAACENVLAALKFVDTVEAIDFGMVMDAVKAAKGEPNE